MLDMAFQLLAFFILTFKSPSAETHVDLDLPATPAALPARSEGRAQPRKSRRVDTDLENDLLLRAGLLEPLVARGWIKALPSCRSPRRSTPIRTCRSPPRIRRSGADAGRGERGVDSGRGGS